VLGFTLWESLARTVIRMEKPAPTAKMLIAPGDYLHSSGCERRSIASPITDAISQQFVQTSNRSLRRQAPVE